MFSTRKIIYALLLTSLLLTTGCTTKMTYRFLDWFVAWSVDDYVDWDREQKREFSQRLDAQLLWHQRTQLPRYSLLLQDFKEDVQTPISSEQLQAHLDTMALLWTDALEHIEPDITYLMSTLSDEQVETLLAKLEKDSAKMEKKYTDVDKETLDKERVKGIQKFSKRIIGRLTPEQKESVELWSESLEDSRDSWLQSRRRWAQSFAESLEQRAEPQFAELMSPLFIDPQSLWDENYQQQIEVNTRKGINLAMNIQHQFTDKQLKKVDKEIGKLVKALDSLAAEVALDPEPLDAQL